MLHFHKWSWMGQGYIEWVPEMGRKKKWISIHQCTKCDKKMCDLRDLIK